MSVDTTEIKKNSDWYYANLDSLLPKYDGKFIGISDCSVVGVFNTAPSNSRAIDRVKGLCASNTPPPSAHDGRNVGCSAQRTRHIRGPFPNHRFSLGGSHFAATDSHSSFYTISWRGCIRVWEHIIYQGDKK